jgi:hypothetical protein
MKKLLVLLVGAMLLTSSTIAMADSLKDRQEELKASKKELNAKASKEAKKEAKHLKKQGWLTTPGALSLEKQLDKSYTMQYMYDEDFYPKYIMAEAMSVGSNYDAAKMQALELSKQNLAGQIQTEVTALIENTVANNQLEEGEAASITKSVMASKNLISQSIGRVVPVVETYRTNDKGNKEVLIRIAYSVDSAKKAAKKAIKQDLEQRGDSLHSKLDSLLGLK